MTNEETIFLPISMEPYWYHSRIASFEFGFWTFVNGHPIPSAMLRDMRNQGIFEYATDFRTLQDGIIITKSDAIEAFGKEVLIKLPTPRRPSDEDAIDALKYALKEAADG